MTEVADAPGATARQAEVDELRARVARLENAILDIDARAAPIGLLDENDPEGSPAHYFVTTGSLHRALGVVGHCAAKADEAKQIEGLLNRVDEEHAAYVSASDELAETKLRLTGSARKIDELRASERAAQERAKELETALELVAPIQHEHHGGKVGCVWFPAATSETRRAKAAEERARTAEARVVELEDLAYIGRHHFPDLTWKARCEELRVSLRTAEAELARVRAERASAERVSAGRAAQRDELSAAYHQAQTELESHRAVVEAATRYRAALKDNEQTETRAEWFAIRGTFFAAVDAISASEPTGKAEAGKTIGKGDRVVVNNSRPRFAGHRGEVIFAEGKSARVRLDGNVDPDDDVWFVLENIGREPEPAEAGPSGRCDVTGNPCGTDSRMVGSPCLCQGCTNWRAEPVAQGVDSRELKHIYEAASLLRCLELQGAWYGFENAQQCNRFDKWREADRRLEQRAELSSLTVIDDT